MRIVMELLEDRTRSKILLIRFPTPPSRWLLVHFRGSEAVLNDSVLRFCIAKYFPTLLYYQPRAKLVLKTGPGRHLLSQELFHDELNLSHPTSINSP